MCGVGSRVARSLDLAVWGMQRRAPLNDQLEALGGRVTPHLGLTSHSSHVGISVLLVLRIALYCSSLALLISLPVTVRRLSLL